MPLGGQRRLLLLPNPQLPRQALVQQTPRRSCLSRVRARFSYRRKAGVSSSSASTFRSLRSLSKICSFPSGSTHSRIPTRLRSEEHTSELQSQSNLVCRLLLEKKKNHY